MAFYILIIMPITMSLCYYCSKPATHFIKTVVKTINVCRTCYLSHSVPTGNPMSYRNNKKTARLIYEPSLQGYSLSFSYNKDIVEFIKKAIPSHKRTYDPTSYTWYFGSEYFDLVKMLFDGHREYTLTIVSENEVKKKLEESQQASQSSWHPAQYSIEDELQRFSNLLVTGNIIPPIDNNQSLLNKIKNITKSEAIRLYRKAATVYHPDRNGGDGSKMSELNSVWAILKEGYYIK